MSPAACRDVAIFGSLRVDKRLLLLPLPLLGQAWRARVDRSQPRFFLGAPGLLPSALGFLSRRLPGLDLLENLGLCDLPLLNLVFVVSYLFVAPPRVQVSFWCHSVSFHLQSVIDLQGIIMAASGMTPAGMIS